MLQRVKRGFFETIAGVVESIVTRSPPQRRPQPNNSLARHGYVRCEDILRGLALFDLERASIAAGQAWAAACWQRDAATARLAADFPSAGVYCLSLRLHAQEWIAWLQAALAIDREIGDRHGEGADLGNLGNAYRDLGQPDKAHAYLQQALAIFEDIKSPYADRVRKWLAALDAP